MSALELRFSGRHVLALLVALMLALLTTLHAANSDETLLRFAHLVRTDSWTEKWPEASGEIEERAVNAEIWNDAIQAALDQANSVHLPKRDQPYYLDGPITLRSGQKLTADADTEIRLKPGTNTCMVRNENIITLNTKPVPADLPLDTDITIAGGIWTTLATADNESNGNLLGRSSGVNPAFGTHGVILLQNVRRVSVKNVTVRQSIPFGVHLANAHDFIVENITLEEHRRDGVHVNGPASDGLIRGVRGDSKDDDVALNAWEWKNYAPSYGSIERIVVEDVTGWPGDDHDGNIARCGNTFRSGLSESLREAAKGKRQPDVAQHTAAANAHGCPAVPTIDHHSA
jgi:hypothetical protein